MNVSFCVATFAWRPGTFLISNAKQMTLERWGKKEIRSDAAYLSVLHRLFCLSFCPRPRYNLCCSLLEKVDTHAYTHTYIHTCMHACIHTCMHTYIHNYIQNYIHTYIHTYMHACIHTYINTLIHTLHTYIHQKPLCHTQLFHRLLCLSFLPRPHYNLWCSLLEEV